MQPVFLYLKVPIFICVLPFEFRPGEPSGFDLLSSPDNFPFGLFHPGAAHRVIHIRRFQRYKNLQLRHCRSINSS